MGRKDQVHRRNTNGIGKIVSGLVFGSMVGATVGLLMAPASGEETRRKITGEIKGLQSRTKGMAGNIEEKSREMIGDARENFDRVRESVAERLTRRRKNASK